MGHVQLSVELPVVVEHAVAEDEVIEEVACGVHELEARDRPAFRAAWHPPGPSEMLPGLQGSRSW